jgi:hypothetical protein
MVTPVWAHLFNGTLLENKKKRNKMKIERKKMKKTKILKTNLGI